MTALLREACHRVRVSTAKVLNEAERRRLREHDQAILTKGGKEMPDIRGARTVGGGGLQSPTRTVCTSA